MTTKQELVEAVKKYALDNYNAGGWDVIVECWSDAEIEETIGAARTPAGAIKKVAVIVEIYADREADARNSAF